MRTPLEHRDVTRRTPSRRTGPRLGQRAGTLALAMLTAATTLAPRTAHAEEVTPTAKGIVGTALLGSELVVFTEAIFGVKSGTAYLLGAAGGAVAGGVGGYFIEQAVDDGRIPAYLLAGGLALTIPAIVVALDATRYRPTEGAREDKPSGMPSDPGNPGGSAVIGAEPPAPTPPPATAPTETPPPSGTTEPAPAPAPGGAGGGGTQGTRAPVSSLFDVNGGAFRVGVPVPEVRPVLGSAERKAFGVQNNGSEVRFPVVRVAF